MRGCNLRLLFLSRSSSRSASLTSLFASLFLFYFCVSFSTQKQDYEDHIYLSHYQDVCMSLKSLKTHAAHVPNKIYFLTGTSCPAGALTVFYNSKFGPETHNQRQAAMHDCLPRLLANEDT
jgi:hypothetical protein